MFEAHDLSLRFWWCFAGDDNIGHLIWEDFFSMWVGLRSLGLLGRPVQVLNVGTPCEGLCLKMANVFMTKLGMPIQMYDNFASSLTQQTNTLPICFSNLVVGGYVRIMGVDTSLDRGVDSLFQQYRALALKASGFNPDYIPSEHHIVLVNKHHSNRGTLRNIVNSQEVETFMRRTYPGIKQSVVDWKDLTMEEQFSLLLSTTIVVSPQGGCSTLLPFLPRGAHAITMDYPEGSTSISLEGGFWDHWSHIKNDFYLVHRPEQVVWEEICDSGVPKECTRVLVDVRQLQILIDAAIAEMSIAAEPYSIIQQE